MRSAVAFFSLPVCPLSRPLCQSTELAVLIDRAASLVSTVHLHPFLPRTRARHASTPPDTAVPLPTSPTLTLPQRPSPPSTRPCRLGCAAPRTWKRAHSSVLCEYRHRGMRGGVRGVPWSISTARGASVCACACTHAAAGWGGGDGGEPLMPLRFLFSSLRFVRQECGAPLRASSHCQRRAPRCRPLRVRACMYVCLCVTRGGCDGPARPLPSFYSAPRATALVQSPLPYLPLCAVPRACSS